MTTVEASLFIRQIRCASNSSFPPQDFTGSSLPDPVLIPWCSQGLVNFYSDDMLTDSGFNLEYYVSYEGTGPTIIDGLPVWFIADMIII